MSLPHRRLAAWFLLLAQQLEAGLPLADALRSTREAGGVAGAVDAMIARIERGGSTDDALRAAGPWLPLADQLALSAAAEAGRMPPTLRALAARHEQLRAAKWKVLLATAYSAAVLHAALLALPALRMIDWEKGLQWNPGAYGRSVLTLVLPLWTLGAAGFVLVRRRHPLVGRVARRLPALGAYLRAQALADLAFALGNFLDAGIPIGRAWAAAGLIARTPELQDAATALEAAAARGQAPGPQLATWGCFPADFIALYRSGETSGRLEESLQRITATQQAAADRALGFATLLYPGLLFAAAAAAAVYTIFTVYAGYFRMIDKLVD